MPPLKKEKKNIVNVITIWIYNHYLARLIQAGSEVKVS